MRAYDDMKGIPEEFGFPRQPYGIMWDDRYEHHHEEWRTLVCKSIGRMGFHIYPYSYPEMKNRWRIISRKQPASKELINATLSMMDLAIISNDGSFADPTLVSIIDGGCDASAPPWLTARKTIERVGYSDPLWADGNTLDMLRLVPKAADMLEGSLPMLGARMPGLRLPARRRRLVCNIADLLRRGRFDSHAPGPWETIGRSIIGDGPDDPPVSDYPDDWWERHLPLMIMTTFDGKPDTDSGRAIIENSGGMIGEPDREAVHVAFLTIMDDLVRQYAAGCTEGVGGENPMQAVFMQKRSMTMPLIAVDHDRSPAQGADIACKPDVRTRITADPVTAGILVNVSEALLSSGALADPDRFLDVAAKHRERTADVLTGQFMSEAGNGRTPGLVHDLPRGFWLEGTIAEITAEA